MPNKRFKYFTNLFCLGLIFIASRGVLSQECPDPDVPNSIFAGDRTVGGNAAIICNTGYEGGGTIICEANLDWQSKPSCTPRDCPEQTVANGNLIGELFYSGSATVYCDPGYEGGGAAECGSNGAWVTVPACGPIDCHDPVVPNGVSVASTLYGNSHFIQCYTGYTGGGADGIECLANGTWHITLSCDARVCGDPQVANGNLTGDDFYDGTASIECHPGYEGGGSLTCQSTGNWGTKPSCYPKDCGQPTADDGLLDGSLTSTSSTLFDGEAIVECDNGFIGGGTATCLDTGDWATLPPCDPIDEDKAQSTYTGAIVGGSIGGFVAGVLVSLLGLFLYWRFCRRNGLKTRIIQGGKGGDETEMYYNATAETIKDVHEGKDTREQQQAQSACTSGQPPNVYEELQSNREEQQYEQMKRDATR